MSSNVHALELSKAFKRVDDGLPAEADVEEAFRTQATIQSVLGCSTPQLASCGPFENFLPAPNRRIPALQFRWLGLALNVCLWHFADIPPAPTNVRYWG